MDKQPSDNSATTAQRILAGIAFALSLAGLCGAYYLEIVHGSTTLQTALAAVFVVCLFAACAIGTKPDLFVEKDDDEGKPPHQPDWWDRFIRDHLESNNK